MLFSIIIPVFNCEKSISLTVDSIISSALEDYEIILVNDGSTDGTAHTCKNLCAEYSFIKYYEQENSGVSAARNNGLSLATGEYILFFDADDTVKEKGFQECVDIIKGEKPDILIFGMSFDYYKNARLYRSDKMLPEKSGLLNKAQLKVELDSLYNTNSLTPVWNKIYRRGLITENNILFNTDYFLMEDFLFSLQCLIACENIYCLQKALYCYKQSENEKNAFNRVKRIDSFCDYILPFKTAINELEANEKKHSVFNNFFFMLLSQRMYFASKKEIKDLAEEVKSNKLFDEIKQMGIPGRYISFFKDVEKSRYLKIRLLNLKTQLRHKIAVGIKSAIH